MIQKIIKSPNFIYIFSKYGIFIISFFNSLFIAVKLGALNLGIWGFINLIIGYLTYASIGIPNAMNILISKNKFDRQYSERIYHNSFGLLSIMILILVLLFGGLYFFNVEIGSKFNFASYSALVASIVILNLINGNLSIILRIYNKVNLISFSQSFYPILTFLAIFIFNGENLLNALVYILLFSSLFTTILYIYYSPFKLRISLNLSIMKTIQTKGFFLFVYNASFYFIMLSTKTLISSNYSVEEFGFFTFSFSFANAVLLLMTTISFLIFPKMIALMASTDNIAVSKTISKVRTNYIILAHLLIHISIFIFPFFIKTFPQYLEALTSFQLIALTLIMYNNAFGYQVLLMARDKERTLSLLSFSALALNVGLGLLLVKVFDVSFAYVIVCTLITYFLYVTALTYLGRKSLKLEINLLEILKDAHNYKVLTPYLVSLGLIIAGSAVYWFLIPLLLLLLLNIREFKSIIISGKHVMMNPNSLNI